MIQFVTCEHCGKPVLVGEESSLRYVTREPIDSDPKTFLIMERTKGGSDWLLHRCVLGD